MYNVHANHRLILRKNPMNRRVFLWSFFILGIIALLFGLAKLGSNAPAVGSATLTLAVSADDWISGTSTASHTLVEYSDFQCPACATYEPQIHRIITELPNDVRVVYRHFPLKEIHPNAQIAAQAAEAAGMQGKFWQFHDALFNTQDAWSGSTSPQLQFEDYAFSLGLDVPKFKTDIRSDAVLDRVKRTADSAESMGLSSTPTFFLDGKKLDALPAYEDFKKLVTGI